MLRGKNDNISAIESQQQHQQQPQQQETNTTEDGKKAKKEDEMTRIPFKVDMLREMSYSGDDPNDIPTWNEW